MLRNSIDNLLLQIIIIIGNTDWDNNNAVQFSVLSEANDHWKLGYFQVEYEVVQFKLFAIKLFA